jgi:hypothetical protein
MPNQVDGLQPAAKGGGKRTGARRFQSRRRTKDQEQHAKVAETAQREESSLDVAGLATELTTLRAEVKRLSKEIEKLAKQTQSLQKQFESERQRSHSMEERVKELRAATVESDIAHAEQLAKVCSQRESLSRTVRKLKAQRSKGSLSAARCREKAKAVKARMARRAYGGLRPLSKRIRAPPVRNGADYRGFKRREVAQLKQYLDSRYEDGLAGDTVVQLLKCLFNKCPEILDYVCQQRGLYSAVEEHVVETMRALDCGTGLLYSDNVQNHLASLPGRDARIREEV